MNKLNINNPLVIGGGSWGTALAIQITRKLNKCNILVRDNDQLEQINTHHLNKKYLPSSLLPSSIVATIDNNIIAKADLVIIALPSNTLSSFIENNLELFNNKQHIVVATKGIEIISKQFFIDYLVDKLKHKNISCLSGPNFALEVAQNLPTETNIATFDLMYANILADLFTTSKFKVTPTSDYISVQVAGCLKNIIALMVGIILGTEYGENARAIIISRGLKEIMMLAVRLGGKASNYHLCAVVGDLSLTCNSATSRNTQFGYKLSRSQEPQSLIRNYNKLVEAMHAINAISELAEELDLELPIVKAIARIISLKSSISEELEQLFGL